jgi:hypothetical protein
MSPKKTKNAAAAEVKAAKTRTMRKTARCKKAQTDRAGQERNSHVGAP